MDSRKEKKDKSTEEASCNSSQKISPITNLPLMIENISKMDERKSAKKIALDPIVRPTTQLCVYGVKKPLVLNGPICVCLKCTEAEPCILCICQQGSRKKASEEETSGVEKKLSYFSSIAFSTKEASLASFGEYIDASRTKAEKKELLKDIFLCNRCKLGSVESFTYGKEECVVKFFSVSQTIDFYLAHSTFFLLEWVPCIFEKSKALQKVNLPIAIMERAFSCNLQMQRRQAYSGEDTSFYKSEKIGKTFSLFSESERANNFVYLASGKHSNITLQTKLCNITQKELLETLQKISTHSFFFLSKHKYGTYVIQTIIKIAGCSKVIQEIKKLMFPYASALLQDSIGNYVVQKMLSYDAKFVLDCFFSDFETILKNKIGARAFKNCIKNFLMYHKDILPRLHSLLSENFPQDEQKILKIAAKELFSMNNFYK